MIFRFVAIAFALACFSSTATAKLRLASLFSDHMVLQRDMPIPVWGNDDPGSTVDVEFAGQKKTTSADADGKWKVQLDSINASKHPRELVVTSSGSMERILITDVLVGEVWICSGQSNMQMGYGGINDIAELVPDPANDQSAKIRSFEVKRSVALTEQDQCGGQWVTHQPGSAVAFAFAHFLQEAADVPVGIILTCWGSSSLEAWMPRDMTETVPHFKTMMQEFDADKVTLEKIQAILDAPKPWSRVEDVFLRRQTNILYNAMMHPLIPFACRGLVWYQGERNTQSMRALADGPWYSRMSGMLHYDDTLEQWIQRYRKSWNHDDMHFLVVMLPGFGKCLPTNPDQNATSPTAHSWSWMRESQLNILKLPNTGVANTIDLGHIKNIHPKDKLPIGKRLALLAARDSLGHNVVAEGPKVESIESVDGSLVVHFDHAEGLKTTDGKSPTGFWLSDQTGAWVAADATISGDSVQLRTSELARPLYVRYAFAGKPEVNLINGSELPAYPFRTDHFDPFDSDQVKRPQSKGLRSHLPRTLESSTAP